MATDDLDGLYRLVGATTIHWALMEQALDQTVLIIFHKYGGRSLQYKLPRPLEQKLSFLRSAFSSLGSLASFSGEGLAIIEKASSLSVIRHNLVHGAVTSVSAINGAFTFARFEYGKEVHSVENTAYTPKDFQELGEDLPDLALRVARLAHQLVRQARE